MLGVDRDMYDIEQYLLEKTVVSSGKEFLKKYVKDYELYEELMKGIPLASDSEIFSSFRQRMLKDVKPFIRKLV